MTPAGVGRHRRRTARTTPTTAASSSRGSKRTAKIDADFWGWGEHAPIKDRRIVFGNNIVTRSRTTAAGV